MSTEKKIKTRLADAVVQSRLKPWYKRLSGRIILTILGVFALFVFYLSLSSVTSLVRINKGDVFDQTTGTWTTYEEYKASQEGVSQVITEDDPFLGTDEPLVYIVAYESFACPFCKSNQADLKRMLDKFGPVVRFIFKDFPTESLHPNVFEAHLAAGCAQDQNKFWEYHDVLFANQENLSKSSLKQYAKDLGLDMNKFDACLDNEEHASEIRQDYAQGVDLGAKGTPAYFINGQLINYEIPYDLWEQILGFIIKEQI